MRNRIPALVEREIRGANRGEWPHDKETFERAAARFGFDVEYLPAPFTADQSGIFGTTICVPIIDPGETLHRCYLHELAEACLQWDGRAPVVTPAQESPRRHDIARCIDLLEPRGYLTQDLQIRISRMAGRLAALVSAAGFEKAYLSIAPDGVPTIRLEH